MKNYPSWGNIVNFTPEHIYKPQWIHDVTFPETASLCYGKGRSYGDSCHLSHGTLIDTSLLSKFIHFNPLSGILRCESGVTLGEILDVCLPKGWFLPVTPGTKFVTIGGAIANDVHGKNHHAAGNFGNHVRAFELLRSSHERLLCSTEQNTDIFSATIGGLGLTGIITWAEIQLKKIFSPLIDAENIKFGSIDEFLSLSSASEEDFEYTVSWIDCTASGKNLGRGIFIRGNHSKQESPLVVPKEKHIPFPVNAPQNMLNKLTIKAFNGVYFNKQLSVSKSYQTMYEPFFYPLDSIQNWNRMYGVRGFYQYQCVVPFDHGNEAMKQILSTIAAYGEGSFLAVLKTFGAIPPLGMMSFPRPGITLALDFRNNGQKILKLLETLDSIVGEARGAVYPAKDARMSASSFQQYYPQWQEFATFIDPKCMSDFWNRVTH